MGKIYYEVIPNWSIVPRYVKEGDYRRVYDLIMQLTGSHTDASNVQGWCELACVGDVYIDDEFTVKIIEE